MESWRRTLSQFRDLFNNMAPSQRMTLVVVPVFVLSGLGGAWVPLDVTGAAFRAVGHVSPVAWAIDGSTTTVKDTQGRA